MTKLLTGTAAAAVLLFVLFVESPVAALGQGVGVYRGRQGRRAGRVTLPTPPFNPDAGILNKRRAGGRESPEATRRRSARRGDKTSGHGTRRRRRARRSDSRFLPVRGKMRATARRGFERPRMKPPPQTKGD